MQHIHSVTTSIVVKILSALLTDEMISDVIILFREKTDIVRSGLDLTRIEDNILLITLATVNDDTIVTVLNGSSRKHIAAYLVADDNLPVKAKVETGTTSNFIIPPYTQAGSRMNKLQFLVVSHQLLNLFRMIFNQVLIVLYQEIIMEIYF